MPKTNKPESSWLKTLPEFVRLDFETGLLYWQRPRKGINFYKPLGCIDTKGYVKVQINNRKTYAHSVVFYLYYGYWPELVDHINRIEYDNRPENLRETNHSLNALNAKKWKTNTSGIKGASITPYGNYKVTKCGKHLGTFKTKEEAADAYNKHR